MEERQENLLEFDDTFRFKDLPDTSTPHNATNMNKPLINTSYLKKYIEDIITGKVDLIVKSIKSKNLFTGFIKGKYVNDATGSIQNNSTSAITDYIEVDFIKNKNYYLSGLTDSLFSFIVFYNDKKEYLGRTSGSSRNSILLSEKSITAGKPTSPVAGDIKYLIIVQYENSAVSGKIDDIDNLKVQLEIGDKETEYGPHQF